MARLIVLDSGPLGLMVRASGKPQMHRCLAWLNAVMTNAAVVVIPEIAHYEVRRAEEQQDTRSNITRTDASQTRLHRNPFWRQHKKRSAAGASAESAAFGIHVLALTSRFWWRGTETRGGSAVCQARPGGALTDRIDELPGW